MPGSSPIFDDAIMELLKSTKGEVLDIGTGSGKMGKLAKDAGCSPVHGIEVHQEYIETYKLKEVYDAVLVGDVRSLTVPGFEVPGGVEFPATFGTVILGDSIEHLPKSAGRDLLEFLVIRSKRIIVKYPVNTSNSCLFQGAVGSNPHEAHVSIWSEADFVGFDVEHHRNGPMRLAIIKGYTK